MEPQAGQQTTTRKQKGRSPRYPGISLDTAVERARQLWAQEHQHPTNVATAMHHWGYGAKSGGGMVSLAALKAYGLIEDSGSGAARTVKVTERAKEILMGPDPEQVQAAIQKAALTPPAHADLWQKYGRELGSNQAIRFYLIMERGFTESGASEFVGEYKRTFNYANLAEATATVSPDGASQEPRVDLGTRQEPRMTPPSTIEQEPPRDPPPPLGQDRSNRTIQVTYSPTEWALLQATFPMSEDDWEAMIEMLKAMKRGLVTPL